MIITYIALDMRYENSMLQNNKTLGYQIVKRGHSKVKKANLSKSAMVIWGIFISATSVQRNFGTELTECNQKAIKFNQIFQSFSIFNLFDWHSIDSINRISIVRLRSVLIN